jgi:hypothetical protein
VMIPGDGKLFHVSHAFLPNGNVTGRLSASLQKRPSGP